MITTEQVLLTWFGTTENITPEETFRKRWFKSNPEFDEDLRRKFSHTINNGYNGRINLWMTSPKTSLALLILFDQFARNIFRGKPEAYKNDEQNQRFCIDGIVEGFDLKLGPFQRAFYYMPLMHSEKLENQKVSIQKFEALAKASDIPEGHAGSFVSFLEYAKQHYEPIERFGRFPYRNQILGRDSTPEEQDFLSTKSDWP